MAIQQVNEKGERVLTPEQKKAKEAKSTGDSIKLAWKKAGGKTAFVNRNKAR